MPARARTPQGPSLEQTSLPIVNSVGALILNYVHFLRGPNLQVPSRLSLGPRQDRRQQVITPPELGPRPGL